MTGRKRIRCAEQRGIKWFELRLHLHVSCAKYRGDRFTVYLLFRAIFIKVNELGTQAIGDERVNREKRCRSFPYHRIVNCPHPEMTLTRAIRISGGRLLFSIRRR